MIVVPSYNQPKFCPSATWNSTGITIANSTMVGAHPSDIFIDRQNSLYVAETSNDRVGIWMEGNTNPISNISGNLESPWSIFVTTNGDIYIDSGNFSWTVSKRAFNTDNNTVAMHVKGFCAGLFIDIADNLYCSMDPPHIVAKQPLKNASSNYTIVAGTGIAGSGPTMLDHPRGIFIDLNFNLYVADCNNDRIQLFPWGQSSGITIPINGSNGEFLLKCPSKVMLDADGYLFIVDHSNHRILGSDWTGFRCIIGCTRTNGSGANLLDRPHSLSFDNHGNLFVCDYGNSRVQKFLLSTNVCGRCS